MKKKFIEKMLECGLSEEQAKQVEKICLDELAEANVSGGGDGICYCPYCGYWMSENIWEEHNDRYHSD